MKNLKPFSEYKRVMIKMMGIVWWVELSPNSFDIVENNIKDKNKDISESQEDEAGNLYLKVK